MSEVIYRLINIYHDLGFRSGGAWRKNFPVKYKPAANMDMELTELREKIYLQKI